MKFLEICLRSLFGIAACIWGYWCVQCFMGHPEVLSSTSAGMSCGVTCIYLLWATFRKD